MTPLAKHPRMRRALLTAALSGGLAALPAAAENGPTMQRSTYKEVEAAHELMDKGRYDQALRDMRSVLRDTERDYDRAVILQTMAYAHLDKNDYPAAIDAFERALALEAMPEQPTRQMQRALGRLYAGTQQNDKARRMLEQWLAETDEASAEDYAAIANVYSQMGDYGRGIDAIRKAIRLQSRPKTSHYQLLIAMCFESERYGEAVDVLQALIERSPDNKQHWTQLANVYMNLDRNEAAHSTLKLAYRKGLLDEQSELLNLVQLGMAINVPYQAAEVLTGELERGRIASTEEHWRLLAQAWSQAKETDKAIRAYDRAAEFTDSGRYQMRQAQLYLRESEWDQVAEAARAAIDRGGLDSPGQAWLLLGMAHVRRDRHEPALKAFEQARRYDATAGQADKWVGYTKQRQKQQAQS